MNIRLSVTLVSASNQKPAGPDSSGWQYPVDMAAGVYRQGKGLLGTTNWWVWEPVSLEQPCCHQAPRI